MRKHLRYSVSWIRAAVKLLWIELGIVLIAFIGAMALVIFLIKKVFIDKVFALDDRAFAWVGKYVSDSTTEFFNFFTLFGSHYFLVPANLLLMAYAFFIMRNKWFGIKISAVAFSSLFLMFSLKFLFNRPRPDIPLLNEVSGFSFPSGHAFMSFAFFGLLIYVIDKQIKNYWIKGILITLFTVIIIIIGMSRIYLRVHYASDVLAGVSLGLIWLVISLSVLNFIEKRKKAIPILPKKIGNQEGETDSKADL
jgi:undecaprenyl-diphosphatase